MGDGEIKEKKVDDLTTTITLEDYLRIYVRTYEVGEPRNEFERQVKEALQAASQLEMLWSVRPQGLEALEIDFVIRLGNQVGVGEVKTKGAKSGIDQINAVAEQRYLGTYVKKFLVSGRPVDRNNKNLAKAYDIKVAEVTSYAKTGSLSKQDQQMLRQRILGKLRGRG